MGAYKIAGGANGGAIDGQPTDSPSYGTILMMGFTELVTDNPLLSSRLAAAAGFAGGVVGGIMLFILLVIVVSYIVNSIQQIQEEFKEDILNWATAHPVASQLPGNNCELRGINVKRVLGWAYCSYSCKSAVPSGTFIARYIPVEFGCQPPVPCVPGLINAESKVPFSVPIDLAVFMCTGLVK